ncbi:hypothetical protein BS78_02G146800 [Paspalum vaginatum]|nr:hypothetical protein BS78_02G146800 [Paspalum vaginatum]
MALAVSYTRLLPVAPSSATPTTPSLGCLRFRAARPPLLTARRVCCQSINSADVLGASSTTSDEAVPVPVVLIDQDSDCDATIVQLSFGDRLGALLDTGWKLWHGLCFRNDHDGPTTSGDGRSFMYVAQSESPSGADVEEEEEVGGSSVEQGQNYKDGGWFLQVQKIKENLHGRTLRFQTQRWTVPWTGQTIAQVMILWIATFWFVGSWIVPFLAHAAGFSKETLTHRGQALYSLLTDITEGLAGIAILHQCLSRFRPLPPGWFEFNLKGKWHLDVALGCLLFPLVNLLSHINISLVPMSPGPVVGVSSVEQSIVARDPVAMALYAVVVTVCAPIWEEIVFRGFLLPSLTRYMPLPWSILASAAAFALAHFNAQRVMPLVFLGVVMGGIFARSRNLLASMVLHSLWNGFVFLDLMK